ncbi:MAG TPA: hypothetical protein VE961_23530, partial [Pyrinomonadaceae bacterium]|nr:hypothetical protein [Pyrinomonadaceae bacterium]
MKRRAFQISSLKARILNFKSGLGRPRLLLALTLAGAALIEIGFSAPEVFARVGGGQSYGGGSHGGGGGGGG